MARIPDLVHLAIGGGQGNAEERRIHFTQFGNVARDRAREMVPVFGVQLQKSGTNEGKFGVASRVRKVHVVVFQMNDAKSVARRLFARQTLPQILLSTMRTMGKASILAFKDGSGC